MEIKKTPDKIYEEYQQGKDYNSTIDLYENVEKNERFYIGNQWEGLNAPSMTKPVFNVIKRVTTYFLAMLTNDDIGVNITPFDETDLSKAKAAIVSKEVEKIIERTKFKGKERMAVRNCCVDGDSCMFTYFDMDIDTHQLYKGDLDNEIVDNTNVIFGNPYSQDVQKQPYIMVCQRLYVEQIKEMARENGCSEDQISGIKADSDNELNTDENLATVLTKFWKETNSEGRKTVHFIKCTSDVILKEETDTECELYPIAYFSWEKVKNSYHGQSPITGLVPNQVFINKLFAMAMVYVTNNGFPKVLYDSTKIKNLTNDVSSAIKVNNLDLLSKVIDSAKTPDFSSQVNQLIDATISYTKDCLGANDAALGNVSANNTSAIISLQQASEAPLELQKLSLYDFVEDNVRIIVDMIASYYGVRKVKVTRDESLALAGLDKEQIEQLKMPMADGTTSEYSEMPETSVIDFDFSEIREMNYVMNVDIGQASYWSELTQINTLDNLLTKGIITDAVDYLDGIPDKYIKNKAKLIEGIKERQKAQEELQQQAAQQSAMQQPEAVQATPTMM